jgi:hypothetical protein
MAGIVADGCCRARRANEPAIRALVEQEFAPRLAAAPLWRRWLLRRALKREVRRRLARVAPANGLY